MTITSVFGNQIPITRLMSEHAAAYYWEYTNKPYKRPSLVCEEPECIVCTVLLLLLAGF